MVSKEHTRMALLSRGFGKALPDARRVVYDMERLSRRILFQTLPDTRRRKRITKKLLGLN